MTLVATDRIDLVRLFLRVAETGQISQAARELGLSQPTASRFLRRLETLVGTTLVDRSGRGARLTQAGQEFVIPAHDLVENWHRAVGTIEANRTALSGTLRIAVPIAIGSGFLAKIGASFARSHPNIAIEWHLRDDPVDVTAEGYDLWIRAGEIRRDDLIVRHIYRVERTLVAPAGWPVASHPRELRGKPAVRLSTFVPGVVDLTGSNGDAFALRQRVMFTTDNLFAARTAVIGGVGYAVLPLWCMQKQLSERTLVRTCPTWRPSDVFLSLAYAPSRRRSRRVATLVAHVKRELQGDQSLGVQFLRDAGASESVVRVSTHDTGSSSD